MLINLSLGERDDKHLLLAFYARNGVRIEHTVVRRRFGKSDEDGERRSGNHVEAGGEKKHAVPAPSRSLKSVRIKYSANSCELSLCYLTSSRISPLIEGAANPRTQLTELKRPNRVSASRKRNRDKTSVVCNNITH